MAGRAVCRGWSGGRLCGRARRRLLRNRLGGCLAEGGAALVALLALGARVDGLRPAEAGGRLVARSRRRARPEKVDSSRGRRRLGFLRCGRRLGPLPPPLRLAAVSRALRVRGWSRRLTTFGRLRRLDVCEDGLQRAGVEGRRKVVQQVDVLGAKHVREADRAHVARRRRRRRRLRRRLLAVVAAGAVASSPRCRAAAHERRCDPAAGAQQPGVEHRLEPRRPRTRLVGKRRLDLCGVAERRCVAQRRARAAAAAAFRLLRRLRRRGWR